MADKEVSSNDRAFLNISRQMRLLENDISGMEAIHRVASRLGNDSYGMGLARKLDLSRPHGEEVQPLVAGVKVLLMDHRDLEARLDKMKDRLERLRELADEYLKGNDIVAARLSKD